MKDWISRKLGSLGQWLPKFHASTTPGDQPDWIGRRLEILGQWLSKNEPTVLEKAFDYPFNLMDKLWKKVFKKAKPPEPIPLPTSPNET